MFSCFLMIAWLYLLITISAFDTSFQPWRGVFGTNSFHKLDIVWENPAYVLIIERKVWGYFVVQSKKCREVKVLIGIFNNISTMSCRSVLLVEERVVLGVSNQPAASHWQTLSHNSVSNTTRQERETNGWVWCPLCIRPTCLVVFL
jgi:hypothetical protein